MSATPVLYESFLGAPVPALTLIDLFAQLRGTRGAFPPLVGAIRFTILEHILPAGIQRFDPPLNVYAQANSSGFYLLSSQVTRTAGSPLTLAPGDYRVRIESDFYQPLEQVITWPAAVDPNWPPVLEKRPMFNLLPAASYPFPDLTPQQKGLGITLIRGSVFETDGTPNPNATVTIAQPLNKWPFNSCTVSPSGDWVLVILDQRTFNPVPKPPITTLDVVLHFDFGDGTNADVPLTVNLAAENSLRQTALRGIVTTTAGVPIPLAVISVSGQARTSLTRKDGQWFFYFGLLQAAGLEQVTATAPNGRGSVQTVNVVQRATVVVPGFRIPMS